MLTKNISLFHALFLLMCFYTTSAMQEHLIQVCTGDECKWIPVKKILESATEPIQKNSKSIFLTSLGFAFDHPKGILYCLGGGIGLTALACFVNSDHYWQTPEHAKKWEKLHCKKFKLNKKSILTKYLKLTNKSKNHFLEVINEHKNSLQAITKEIKRIEENLEVQHKKTLEEDKKQIGLFEKEQDELFDSSKQELNEEINKELTTLLDTLKEKKQKIKSELTNLEKQQKKCTTTVFGGLKRMRSIREAFEIKIDTVDAHYMEKEDQLFLSIEKEQSSTLNTFHTAEAQLQQIGNTLSTQTITSEEDFEKIRNAQSRVQSSLFEVQKTIGMIPTNPGGFPGLK